MKNLLLSIFVLSLFGTTYGQKPQGEVQTCYQKYAAVFEKRGANEIENGTHDDVIITFRKGSMADCFYGKVKVVGGNISIYEMFLKIEDDTFEKIHRQFRYPEQAIEVKNGMSRTMVTIEDELITVLFIKKIKPKKKSYLKAPEPDFDF
jgi:hypothetical protein